MISNPKVFLSHSTADEAIVLRVAEELRAMGFQTWVSGENVAVGSSIPLELDRAFAEAHYILLFWSENSANSPWVRAEYDAALFRRLGEESVLLIPLLLDQTELPPLLRPISYLDFRQGIDIGIAKLKRFFGREGFGPEQPPKLLQSGPSCSAKLGALRNMELRLLLKERLSINDVREVWIDVFSSSLDNDLPGMPLGVVVGEMIIRADQRRVREDMIHSICANRPDMARN